MVESRADARGERGKVPVCMRMDNVRGALHQLLEHGRSNASKPMGSVEEFPNSRSSDRERIRIVRPIHPFEGSIPHQVGGQDLDLDPCLFQARRQVVNVLFDPSNRGREPLRHLQYPHSVSYGSPGTSGSIRLEMNGSRMNGRMSHGLVSLTGLKKVQTS